MQWWFQSQKRCKDKLELTRNKHRITVTSRKTTKVRPGFVLNQNREASLEDSTSVEGFLSVWGFNGEQRRFVVATGGCGWWRKNLECWKWFWKKEGEGNDIFLRLHEKQRLKYSSVSARGKGSVPHTPDVVSKIERSDRGQVSCEAVDQISRRSNS